MELGFIIVIAERKLLVISGPLMSIGRSGASWGKELKEWDVIKHFSINDILRNNEEASRRGYSVLVVFWEKDLEQISPRLLHGLTYITIPDTNLYKEQEILGTPNTDEYVIRKFGNQGKDLLSNDQRQLLSLQAGINYGRDNGFLDVLRIRSDQVFTWEIMDKDFQLAINQNKVFLPAQRDLNALDLGYTGFSFLDFFIGGKIQELDFMVRLALSQGRLVGPHYDLIWKYLPFNGSWSRIHPGFSTFKGTSNQAIQEIYARDFWSLIAFPCSRSNMHKLVWRGIQLNEIPYRVCSDNLPSSEFDNMISNEGLDLTVTKNLYGEYNWGLISKYLTGPQEKDPKLILEAYCKLYLDHAKHIGRQKQIESQKIPVWQLASKAFCFAIIAHFRSSRLWHFASKVKKVFTR